MNHVRLTLRNSVTIALLASVLQGPLQIVRADEYPSQFTLDATEVERTDPTGPGLRFDRYAYRGPDQFRVFGKRFVRYGKLRVGDALPVGGAIYRVSTASRQRVAFVKVADEELPQPLKLRAGSYAIPLHSNGRFHPWEFKVKRIESNVDGEPRVTIVGYFPGDSMSGSYRTGDSINANGSLHRILNIVPAKDIFTGWIELEMTARKGPVPRKTYLVVYSLRGRLEIPLVPSPDIRGGKSTVVYGDAERRQEVVDFLVEHRGFAVPFLTKVYRVKRADTDRISCQRVPDDELPMGSVPRPGNYLLPVGLRQSLDEWDYRVSKISTHGARRTATIEGYGKSAGKFGTYRIDDDIVFNGISHRVLNIVPSNEAKKMVGWVEVTPSPPR